MSELTPAEVEKLERELLAMCDRPGWAYKVIVLPPTIGDGRE